MGLSGRVVGTLWNLSNHRSAKDAGCHLKGASPTPLNVVTAKSSTSHSPTHALLWRPKASLSMSSINTNITEAFGSNRFWPTSWFGLLHLFWLFKIGT